MNGEGMKEEKNLHYTYEAATTRDHLMPEDKKGKELPETSMVCQEKESGVSGVRKLLKAGRKFSLFFKGRCSQKKNYHFYQKLLFSVADR